MITVPKILLQKMCSAYGGTNSSKWYCEKSSEKDLVLNYSVARDFFTMPNTNEVEFCKDYKQWYDRQFCGPIADTLEKHLKHFENGNLLSIIKKDIPDSKAIFEILINAVPSETDKTMFKDKFELLSSSFYNELTFVAKGQSLPPQGFELILRKIFDALPDEIDENLKPFFVSASQSIFELYINTANKRASLLAMAGHTEKLSDDVQSLCFPERDESAREVNNYCTGVLANHDTVALAQIGSGSAGGTGIAFGWKKIWKGMKWLWGNKSKISSTFKAIGAFIDKLSTIWVKKGEGSAEEPKVEPKAEPKKTTTSRPKGTNPTTQREKQPVTSSSSVKPDINMVRAQIGEYSENVRGMDIALQNEIAKLAIDQWNEIAPQKQARFLTEDAKIPETGRLPRSYLVDFVKRSNSFANITAEMFKPTDMNPNNRESVDTNPETRTDKPSDTTAKTEIPVTEESLSRELRISRTEARKIIYEAGMMWDRMPLHERESLAKGRAERPNMEFIRNVTSNRSTRSPFKDLSRYREEPDPLKNERARERTITPRLFRRIAFR